MSQTANTAETGTHVFTISRVFNAPLDLVWRVHTEPEHLMHWWGPKGFKMLAANMDLRPGGMLHYCVQSPDGSMELWGKFVYREVVPQEKLVFVVSFSDKDSNTVRHPMAPTWPLEVLNTALFSEKDGKTTITISGYPIHASAEEQAAFEAGREGMHQGFNGSYDQLDAYLQTL